MKEEQSPDTFRKALRCAAEAHQGQLFPGTELPYFLHVCEVAAEVSFALENTGCIVNKDHALAAALLHDTLEDTSLKAEEIEILFGKKVLNTVKALTKNVTLPSKEEQMRDSLKRISADSSEAGIVKMCDRICNLQAPPHYWSVEKISLYKEEAQLILETLRNVCSFTAKRLEEKIKAYAEFCR